jgi:alpha-beta hydrolase superfamily lysophospholipase
MLYGTYYLPDGNLRGLILLVHGLGEHSGRYREMAEHFARQGFAVFAFDLRGHGRSEGRRGHARALNVLMNDLQEALVQLRHLHLDLPLFILGHSMGGTLVANYLIRFPSREVTGAILSSPWFILERKVPLWKQKAAGWLYGILPAWRVSGYGTYEELAHNPEAVEAARNDELSHDYISLALYVKMKRAAEFALSNAASVNIPLLVCHGDDDPITGRHGSEQFARLAGATCQIWKNARHEPHQEVFKQKVFDFYSTWISNQMNK